MQKVGIVAFHNLHLMQFLYKYTDILDRRGIPYDVIYWNRNPNSEIEAKKFRGNAIPFSYEMDNYQPKYKKVTGFIKCILFMSKKIRENQYDKIIFLTTQTILPLFFTAMRYKEKYIYDYRDITYEKNKLAKKMIQKLIQNSYVTCMSSMGFKKIVGDNEKILQSHNCSEITYEKVDKKKNEKLRITFWGMVRQIEFNQKICDIFGNDERLILTYHGEGYCNRLKEYCNKKNYHNIYFTGRYRTTEIKGFAEETDVLLNVYENDAQQKLAMTVKYYDGIRYGIPMIVAKDSYMEENLKNNKAVYFMDVDHPNVNELLEWCQMIAKQNKYFYQKELDKIKEDDKIFEERLVEFCLR